MNENLLPLPRTEGDAGQVRELFWGEMSLRVHEEQGVKHFCHPCPGHLLLFLILTSSLQHQQYQLRIKLVSVLENL